MTTPWRKLIAGSDRTVSRLHDKSGRRIALGRLVRNGPRALLSGAARLAFGRLPPRPWISYDATRVIAGRLGPASRVLEFGSGMSTAWFADRVASVVSIEHDPSWHDIVQVQLARAGRGNVRLRLAKDPVDYTTIPADEADGEFDFILVDGSWRDRCTATAIALVRPGGAIYVDNVDRGVNRVRNLQAAGDGIRRTPIARRLLAFAAQRGATVTFFTDFAPGQLFVQTGMLVLLPSLR